LRRPRHKLLAGGSVIALALAYLIYTGVTQSAVYFVTPAELRQKVQGILRARPKTPVLIRGDRKVDYGQVVQAMALLQAAGAPSVGLITETPAPNARGA